MVNKRFLTVIGILIALTSLLGGCVGSPEERKLAELTKKAEAGDAEAQVQLARVYYNGEGVAKDEAKSVEWMQKAAAQGHAEGQCALGVAYYIGIGVPKDMAKAVEWYQKAAAQGYAPAQCLLGQMYFDGEGVFKDMAKAVEWYQKAAAQGYADAQVSLGVMYFYGVGVPEDRVKAAEWYQKAAAQGHARAQYELGWLYRFGEGVPKDAVKAIEWYQKAAAQGNAMAQHKLGMAYSDGEGVPKDEVKAVEWYQKAAAQGYADAQGMLGAVYYDGEGVGQDRVLAYAWYNLAAANGDRDSLRSRDEIVLTPAQRAEAQRLSSNWKKGQILAREGKSAAGDESSAQDSALSKAGTGTAFFVTPSGQAITNYHVVSDCKQVRAEGREGVVKVITIDAVNDIALIQIPGSVNAAAAISSDPSKLRQGEDIVVFGFPLNTVLSSGGNLTPGVVSALSGLGNNTNQIQITAPIQPGSSGSPVLNKKGEVVGMVLMKLSDREMVKATGTLGQNVNFAVSGQTLKTFLDTHKVSYRRTWFLSFDKGHADLADEARRWTLVVECWK